MPDTAPGREEAEDGAGPAAAPAVNAAEAVARAAIEAALARHGGSIRETFWRAVDRCYAGPYRPRSRKRAPTGTSGAFEEPGDETCEETRMRPDATFPGGSPAARSEPRLDPSSGLRRPEPHPPCGPPPLEVEPPPAPTLPPHSPATAGPSAAPRPSARAATTIPPFGPPRLETEPEVAPHLGPHSPASAGGRGEP